LRKFAEYRKFVDRGMVTQSWSACFFLTFHNHGSFCC